MARTSPGRFVLASIPVIGCAPAPDDRLVVTDIRLDDDATIILTFNHPIANADEIDPNDFRISVGYTHQTTYTGPLGDSFTEQGGRYTDLGYYVVPDFTRFEFGSATLGSDDELLLVGELAFAAYTCEQIAAYEAQFAMYNNGTYLDGVVEMAMFLHYAGGDIPLQDAAGNTLADIGPDWVLSDNMYELLDVFGFPNLTPKLEIPCP
jgi:hypothetical protein